MSTLAGLWTRPAPSSPPPCPACQHVRYVLGIQQLCSCCECVRSAQATAIHVRPATLDEPAAAQPRAQPLGCRQRILVLRRPGSQRTSHGQGSEHIKAVLMFLADCVSTLGCSSTHAMRAHMHCSTPFGRCMGCCWMQDGRKCRSSMAACLHGRKCQNLVAVCACCCLCSTTHSCASKCGMVHTLFGMPSRACVSISNKAQQCQIKLD